MVEQEKIIIDKHGKEKLRNIHDAFLYFLNDYKNATDESKKVDIGAMARNFVDNLDVDLYSFLSDNNCEDFLAFPNYETDIKSCINKLEKILNSK